MTEGHISRTVTQKHLPMGFLAVWMMVITTIQWITLDMYLPALPVLVDEFGVTAGELNISLNAGILAAAVGTIAGGTLSDRYGRKPVILTGLIISMVGNLTCAFANGIAMLCIMRAISGFGSGVVETVAAAILKDSFEGRRFQRNMTLLQAVAAVGPIFAPTFGAIVINLSSWRFVFVFLAATTLITLIPMFVFTESLPSEHRFSNNLKEVGKEAWTIARTPAFSLFLGIGALLTIPIWAFIAVSSYIYIDDYGLSNTSYGIYYAVGAAFSVAAPFVYLGMSKYLANRRIVTTTIMLMAAGGLGLLMLKGVHPLLLLVFAVLMFLSEGMIRPLGLVILLEEYSYVAGSASALIQFVVNIVGAIGTALATLGWASKVQGVGITTLGCTILAVAFWIIIINRGYLKKRLS